MLVDLNTFRTLGKSRGAVVLDGDWLVGVAVLEEVMDGAAVVVVVVVEGVEGAAVVVVVVELVVGGDVVGA